VLLASSCLQQRWESRAGGVTGRPKPRTSLPCSACRAASAADLASKAASCSSTKDTCRVSWRCCRFYLDGRVRGGAADTSRPKPRQATHLLVPELGEVDDGAQISPKPYGLGLEHVLLGRADWRRQALGNADNRHGSQTGTSRCASRRTLRLKSLTPHTSMSLVRWRKKLVVGMDSSCSSGYSNALSALKRGCMSSSLQRYVMNVTLGLRMQPFLRQLVRKREGRTCSRPSTL
jgi:hypothetical protein